MRLVRTERGIELQNSQSENILDYLKKGNTITGLEALRMFGCFRLSSIICRLRKKGNNIKTIFILDKTTGKEYAQYELED